MNSRYFALGPLTPINFIMICLHSVYHVDSMLELESRIKNKCEFCEYANDISRF